ncbi:hypothetical protein DFJ58DRAFT_721148 [Suillus subalutaceus]|uniref:uncharacterized protein n=1 Tax=Suillus subalutaceus TaxID=48586 RepID=UPI001B863242|nr:uncharacterized protein DFJ58DRAFT_721148 [Suillus subalutaceus]KAG1876686.1 hypothetical protein DFJ58DRAFT_721148 [Suillus subalutaceus]
MTAEELFLSCSVNQPLPPPVRGADRLSRHLRDPEARPARSSPYALPGLRKVMVFGPRRQDERVPRRVAKYWCSSSKKLRRNAPTAKDLPPHPLPPLNVSVASAQQGTPPQPLHSHDNGSAESRLELPQQEVQLPPQPVPAERVEEVCATARSRMRRQVLSVNGMPSNDENIAMARTALADAIAHTPNMPAGQHYLPDADTFVMSLTKITGTVRTVVKSAVRAIIQPQYNLELGIWDASSEVAHKLRVVPALTTHLQCLFTTVKMVLDASLSRSCGPTGFYKDLDFNDPTALDGVIALAGAALCSALMEYKTGVYKRVEFSTAKSKDTYQNVTAYISDKIYPRVELAARFKALKDKMKERGEVRLGL